MHDGLMIATLYCLICNRTSQTYTNLLRMIQDVCSEHSLIFDPETFTIDFEIAMISPINVVFPRANVLGCLFHFSQCLTRKIQQIGLIRQYKENDGDNEIQKTVRRVACLPFIRLVDLDETFEDIVSAVPENSLLDQFMAYFFDNFFKTNSRFKRETWNHFLNNRPRTNNHVEGWHHSFNQRIGRNHANLWFFLEKVVQQQEIFENNLLIAKQGNQVNPRNRKNIMRDRRIMNQKLKYARGTISGIQFIDSIMYNFSLNIF